MTQAIMSINVMCPRQNYNSTTDYNISNDLPQDAIGEFVTEEIHQAWKSGLDPANDHMTVILQFR